MKTGMKIIIANNKEWVGPLCISDGVNHWKIMSMSGIMERTRSSGMLGFERNGFDEALPKRYAIAMCPTANEAMILL